MSDYNGLTLADLDDLVGKLEALKLLCEKVNPTGEEQAMQIRAIAVLGWANSVQ